MGLLLLIVLIVLLVGVAPTWPHSRNWGYGPSGGLGLVLVIVLVLLQRGHVIVRLAGRLLDLCFSDIPQRKDLFGEDIARKTLTSKEALNKMREIIKEQGGDETVSREKLIPGEHFYEFKSLESGIIVSVDNKQINILARILGSPNDKKAGVYLARHLEEKIDKSDVLFTLYSSDKWRLKEAEETLKHMPIYKIE